MQDRGKAPRRGADLRRDRVLADCSRSRPQDLQRDIEQHAEGVTSVLTLCDVLLRDADACGGDSEDDSIRQTSRSLDRRWRNICATCSDRRMR